MPFCKNCGYTAASAETECRICGQPLAETPVTVDPNAAPSPTPLAAGAAGASPLVRGANPVLRRLLFVGTPLAVILGGLAFAFHYFRSVPKLEELVPKGVPVVFETDSRWWWDAGADVRAVPVVRDEIKEIEKQSGLSMQNDIASWVGQTGVAVIRADAKRPQAIAYFQVRDWPAFLRFYEKIRQKAVADKDTKSIESIYHGIKVQTFEAKSPEAGDENYKLSVSWVKGWALIGLGQGAVEQAIDTYQGKLPSIASDPTWAAALARRPAHCFAWAGVESSSLAKAILPFANAENAQGIDSVFAPMTATLGGAGVPQLPEAENRGKVLTKLGQYPFVAMGCASDTGNGFRFDAYAVAGSEKVKALWRDVKGTSGGLTGDILSRLPKDSAMAFLAHDPAGWVERYKKIMQAESPAEYHKEIEPLLKQAAPVEAVLADYPGDCALSFTSNDKKGFGAVLQAQGKSPAVVHQSTLDLVSYLTKQKVRVKTEGADQYALPELVDNSEKQFPLAPEFGAGGDYFTATSSPVWTAHGSQGGSVLVVPDEARGADLVAVGNFSWLESAVLRLDPAATATLPKPESKSDDKTLQYVRDTGLESARWDGFTKIAVDGSFQQSTWEISGWNWRLALKNELRDGKEEMAKLSQALGD